MRSAIAREAVLAAGRRWEIGTLRVVLPGGRERVFEGRVAGDQATITVCGEAAFERLLLRGEVGFGEAYVEGLWTSSDLVGLLRLAVRNRAALGLAHGWLRLPARALDRLRHMRRRNSVAGSRANIGAHYDLGNDFYALFLDPQMTYSSAVFPSADATLEEAQQEKYARVARLAGIGPGSRVLEIGCGWGGFALHAAAAHGCRVDAITISAAQHELATRRVAEAGLSRLVDARLVDYREVRGTYDAIVSIEMLEAVGAEYYETFFSTLDRALAPGGRIALQVITVPDRAYEPQRRGANWIQRYIFPGGLLPSLAAIERSLVRTGLVVESVTDIGPHYVRTLAEWRERFMVQREHVRALGYDERFVRMWEYYLAQSEAGFATGITQDLQIALRRTP